MNNKHVLSSVLLLVFGTAVASADEMKVGGTGAALGLLNELSAVFGAAHPGDKIEVVPGLGSSGSINALAEGALQFAVSGRPLKADETARGLHSEPLLDTPFLFVTSHPEPQKLTRAQVVEIFDGSLTRWPDGTSIKPILRPKSDAVTPFLISSFSGMEAAMMKLRQRPDVPVAATDQDNSKTAEKVPNSFAGMTLVQFLTEKPQLRAISLDGVDASRDFGAIGSYPHLMRLYAATSSAATPVAQRFSKFLQSEEAKKLIRASGGIVLPGKIPFRSR